MPEFTREQLMAINARGGTLLVSAAAGSGKTTVLVERVVGLLLDKDDPCPADALIIVTYTKAAATELREKLDSELMRRIDADPYNTYIRSQKLLLQQAVIGTIHSFCAKILREYFAKVLPDFDRERVHNSDIKKLIQWYNILINAGITEFVSEENEEETTEE